MGDREDSMAALMAALSDEPKPITAERVLEVARTTLDRMKAEQFTKWFAPNGARLLERLNG